MLAGVGLCVVGSGGGIPVELLLTLLGMKKFFLIFTVFFTAAVFVVLPASNASAHGSAGERGDPQWLDEKCVTTGEVVVKEGDDQNQFTEEEVSATNADGSLKAKAEYGWSSHVDAKGITHYHRNSRPIYECFIDRIVATPLFFSVTAVGGGILMMIGAWNLLKGFLMSGGGGGGFGGGRAGGKGGGFGYLVFGALLIGARVVFIPIVLWIIRGVTIAIEAGLALFT